MPKEHLDIDLPGTRLDCPGRKGAARPIYNLGTRGFVMSAPTDPPKRPVKVLIPFGATRKQIEEAVEMILGPDPNKQKPPNNP